MRQVLLLALLAAALPVRALAQADGSPPEAPHYPTLKIGGFTDFNFFATDEEEPRSTSGFAEGQFILHFTSALARRVSFFGELSLTGRSSEFRTEVERTIVKFDVADPFKVSLGRYHTPVSWWNDAFHHGLWLQTTVGRPEMVRFGGDYIPVHFVGALTEGTFPAKGLNLRYRAGIGNGRGEIVSRGGDVGDVNNSRAWLVTLSVRPDKVYDLDVGGGYYSDRLTLTGNRDVDESIATFHVVLTSETPEVIAEWSTVDHEDQETGDSFDASAWYVQVAYRVPRGKAKWKPYARYEELDVDPGDPVYGNLRDIERALAGVRYDLVDTLALKFEYRHEDRGPTATLPDTSFSSGHVQVSFTF